MFKRLIDLLIEISDKINFATIIDFEISQIKVVDINDYTIELFTIKIVHGEIYFYNEDYTLMKIKLESLIGDLDIDNVNDFNDIITIVNNIREKYC